MFKKFKKFKKLKSLVDVFRRGSVIDATPATPFVSGTGGIYSPGIKSAGLTITFDRFVVILTLGAAIGIGVLLGTIALTLLWNALPAIQIYGFSFLRNQVWDPVRDEYSILPMIYGTVVSSTIALLLAIVLGVGTGLFLSENGLPNVFRLPGFEAVMGGIRSLLVVWVELLAAIPSVIFGLWGFGVLIPLWKPIGQWLHHHLGDWVWFSTAPVGPGLLPAVFVLTLMIVPLIVAVTRNIMVMLPLEWREAGLALGATRWEVLLYILLPHAMPGILAGAMLALGRALGETMAVTMVIGNANQLNPSLLAPANTIASLLANQFAEAQDIQIAALMYAALILFAITLVVNGLAEALIQSVYGER